MSLANSKIRYQHVHTIMYEGESPRPRITFCYIEDAEDRPGYTYVGVSICSETDNASKREGRKHSYDRALEAYNSGVSSDPILRPEATEVLDYACCTIPMIPTHKSLVIRTPGFRFGFL